MYRLFFILVLAALLTPESLTYATAFVPCSGLDCSSCHLAEMANNIIRWLVLILFVVFAVIMTIAGFGLVTSGGNQAALEAAKTKFKNALIGIIIVMAAWLLVDTLLKALLTGGQVSIGAAPGPWNRVECIDMQTPEGAGDTFSSSTLGMSPYVASTTLASSSQMVDYARQMQAAGCQYCNVPRNTPPGCQRTGCRGTPAYTDCSDLVNNARRNAGLPSRGATTAEMHRPENSIELTPAVRAGLQPGDAIVYRRPDNTGHVVICEDVGCTRVIHARGTGHGIQSTPAQTHLNQPGARLVRRD